MKQKTIGLRNLQSDFDRSVHTERVRVWFVLDTH